MKKRPRIDGVPGFAAAFGGDWRSIGDVFVPVLDRDCHITLSNYEADPRPEECLQAVRAFLHLDRSALDAVQDDVFRYYREANEAAWDPEDEEYLTIPSASDVWNHVRFGTEPRVLRRPRGDRSVYIALDNRCDWEPEHGLLLVFKEGREITRIGPCDGHLTTSDAYAEPTLEDVVYP